MKRTPALVAISALLSFAVRATPLPAQDKPEKTKKAASAPAGTILLAEDKGKFRILLEGQPVGSEEFQISPGEGSKEWTARGKTEIQVPGAGAVQINARLQLSPGGTPLHYEWSAQAQKKASGTVDFRGGGAKLSLQIEGAQPVVQEHSFGPSPVVILDDNLHHHYAILARLYDWSAKGAQTFPVLIPQERIPGSITAEAFGPQDVEGSALELLRVRTADLEVNLYLDSSRRLMRLAVPSAKVVIIRE